METGVTLWVLLGNISCLILIKSFSLADAALLLQREECKKMSSAILQSHLHVALYYFTLF